MKAIVLSLFSVLVVFGFNHSAQACDNYEQLVNQSLAIQNQFGDLNKPNCSSKPAESTITPVITCLESEKASYQAREKSEADLQISGLYGVVTQCYRSGSGQQATGKKSFEAVEASTSDDPTYERAWVSFGDAVAGMKHDGFFKRKAIEIGLGINIDQKVQEAVQGLTALPQDDAVTAELAKLR